ncbi:hypothetical protein [Rhodobium gokarnense]|uniref:Uncharacterized protein n=1 Tax=Rhodobium gokarnense TaxID=364296 RepID=A0ABT3HEW7_9HYPH|nr:hypothetical protein [Rhodobium gokarnense]MCW2308942.1 hypothetical protein [Rhodobium gokarnense]
MEQLGERAKEAVAKALAGQSALTVKDLEFGFLPDPGIVGFIIRDDALGKARAADLSKLASGVVSGLGDLAGGAEPVVLLRDRGGTMGYFPV